MQKIKNLTNPKLKKEPVIVKVTSNFPQIFHNLKKYRKYMNHLIEKYGNSAVFIEDLKGGFLVIYRNYQVLESIMQMKKPEDIEDQILKPLKDYEKALQGIEIIPLELNLHNEFPPYGISIYLETDCPSAEEILKQFEINIISSHESGYIIQMNSPNVMEIHFSEYSSLLTYLSNLKPLFLHMIYT